MLILRSTVRMISRRSLTIRLGVLSELKVLENSFVTFFKSPIQTASLSASMKSQTHICKLNVWPQNCYHVFLHKTVLSGISPSSNGTMMTHPLRWTRKLIFFFSVGIYTIEVEPLFSWGRFPSYPLGTCYLNGSLKKVIWWRSVQFSIFHLLIFNQILELGNIILAETKLNGFIIKMTSIIVNKSRTH